MSQVKIYAASFFFAVLLSLSALRAQTDGLFGPCNLNDKIVAGSNCFVMGTTLAGNTSMELLRVNNSGNLTWRRSYPSGLTQLRTHTRGISIGMGGYVLANVGRFIQPPSINRWELVVIKTNTYGTQQWLRRFQLPNAAQFADVGDVLYTSDMHYLVVGGTQSGDMFAAKINDAGTLIWFRTYGPGFGWSARDYAGGGYIIAGRGQLWRIKSNGDLYYSQPINIGNDPTGAPYAGNRERIQLLQGSGFVIVGSARTPGYSAIFHTRFSWNNGQEVANVYDQTQVVAPGNVTLEISNAAPIGIQSLLIAYKKGNTGGVLSGDLFGIRTDYNGNVQASGPIGNPTDVQFGDFLRTNGKFAFGGTTLAPAQYNLYMTSSIPWIPNPTPGTGNDDDDPLVPTGGAVNVFPNPAEESIMIVGDFAEGGQIRLLALHNGQAALTQTVEAGETQVRLDVAQLQRGIYMLEVNNSGARHSQKVVLR